MIVFRFQVPEPVLQYHRDIVRVRLALSFRQSNTGMIGLERDVIVMLAEKAFFGHARKDLLHHAAQRLIDHKVVTEFFRFLHR